MKYKNIIINSAALFVIATIMQTVLHEKGHFLAATLFHAKDVTLFHNYVQYDSSALSQNSRILIAAAGPVLSLLLGMLFHFICSRLKQRNTLFLFFLYMCVFGYINFFGYLMVSPFFVRGDTGFIFKTLGFPLWVTIIIALAGVVALFYILKGLCRFFIEMASKDIMEDLSLRRPFANSLVQYPLYIGIVLTTLLNLPAPMFLSLFYPLCSPFALMWCYGYLLESKYSSANANTQFESLNKVQPALLVILALVILLNRLLVFGFRYT